MLWGTPVLTEEGALTMWASLKSSNAENLALGLVIFPYSWWLAGSFLGSCCHRPAFSHCLSTVRGIPQRKTSCPGTLYSVSASVAPRSAVCVLASGISLTLLCTGLFGDCLHSSPSGSPGCSLHGVKACCREKAARGDASGHRSPKPN